MFFIFLRKERLAIIFGLAAIFNLVNGQPIGDFSEWKREGDMYLTDASNGFLNRPLENPRAKELLFSGTNGVKGIGRALSPAFTIEKPFLTFALAGYRRAPDVLGVQLVIDGQAVRAASASLRNDALRKEGAGRPYPLVPLCFDLHDLLGKQAHIEVIDKTPTGFLIADRFSQSETPDGFVIDASTPWRESFRPAFHITAPAGWLNDPCGLFYLDGQWTAFHQWDYPDMNLPSRWHHPLSADPDRNSLIDFARKGWKRVVSNDLVHWQIPPKTGDAVLWDSTLSNTADRWSGGAWVDKDEVHPLSKPGKPAVFAFFSRFPTGERKLTQQIAVSLDAGNTWQPLAPSPALRTPFSFDRDPKPFYYAPSGEWFFWLHSSFNDDRTKTAYTLWRSKDLKTWEKIQTFPGAWECPDFFELPVDGDPSLKKWVLLEGTGDYYIGDFSREGFVSQTQRLPGRQFSRVYATQTFENAPDGRRIQLCWAQGDPEWPTPGMPFDHMLSFPVELSLRTTPEGIRLFTEPVETLKRFRQPLPQNGKRSFPRGTTTIEGSKDALLDLELEIDLKRSNASYAAIYVGDEKIECDFSKRKLTPFFTKNPWFSIKGDTLHIRILRDRGILEAFYQHGKNRNVNIACPAPEALPPVRIEVRDGRLALQTCGLYRIDL